MGPAAHFFGGLFLGMAIGAVSLARWWGAKMRNPEYARKMLSEIYKASHPHWLQKSETDETPVCPCCGWSPQ
jgi:hypothetical protein